MKKNTSDQHCGMTLDCVRPTLSGIIQIIHHNVDLKCFLFNFTELFVCYYHYACIFHWYFTQ